MAERRRESILRIVRGLEREGVPDQPLESIREYAENITYCTCGHERTVHGNGIVDRRCYVDGCACRDFTPEPTNQEATTEEGERNG